MKKTVLRDSFLGAVCALAALMPFSASADLLEPQIVEPLINFDVFGTVTYDPSALDGNFKVDGDPIAIQLAPGQFPRFINPTAAGGTEFVRVRVNVTDNGGGDVSVSGVPGPDFIVFGEVDLDGDGSVDAAGALLSGEISAFGFEDSGPSNETDTYDFTGVITGGLLADLFPGPDIGLKVTSEESDFAGDFSVPFSGGAKGTFGAIPPAESCDVTIDKTCLVFTPPGADMMCQAAIAAFRVRYTGPTIAGISHVTIEGGDNGFAEYDVELISGVTVLTGPDGWTIDVALSGGDKLGSKTTLTINGVEEVIHTSCSAIFEAGAPAPLDDPKGDPSPNWFVEGFRDKDGAIVEVPDPTFSDNCQIALAGGTECEQRPSAISIRYNGGDCSQSMNTQDSSKWSCEDYGQSAGEPVRIVWTKTGDNSHVFADVSGVEIGDIVTGLASSAGRDDFDSDTTLHVYDAAGNEIQTIRLHTSCSQPLLLGDRFGAAEIVGFVNDDQGSVSLGIEVIYQYKVSNIGDTDVFNVTLTDDSLDPQTVPGSPIATLPAPPSPDSMATLMTSVFVDGEVNSTVTLTAETLNGVSCEAMDSLNLTVALPPPCEITGGDFKVDDDKIEWELFNVGNNVATIENIEISWPSEFGQIKKVKFDGDISTVRINPPSAVIDTFEGNIDRRQLEPGKDEILKFEFENKYKNARPDDFMITVNFVEGCSITFVPGVGTFDCDKPIDQLNMIWDGADEPVRVVAWKGSVGSTQLLDQDGVILGTEVVVTGYAGSPNDVFWEIFSGGSKLGESKFHLSCSDSEMNGPEDCGTRQGNGKSNDSGLLNDWLLEGMTDQSGAFDCSTLAGGGRP